MKTLLSYWRRINWDAVVGVTIIVVLLLAAIAIFVLGLLAAGND